MKEIRSRTASVCGKIEKSLTREFLGKKKEMTLTLLILVSKKVIILGKSEIVSDTGSFSESVPGTGEASNVRKFRVADTVKQS